MIYIIKEYSSYSEDYEITSVWEVEEVFKY